MLAPLLIAAALAAVTPTLPPAVQAALGADRVVTAADFVLTVKTYAAQHPTLDLLQGLRVADLNGDGQPDYAVLALADKTRVFRFLLLVSQPGGGYATVVKRTFRGAFPQAGGAVYACTELKPAGATTWADKLYSPFAKQPQGLATYQAASAVALWRSVGQDPYERPDDYAAVSLSYCRDVFHYTGNRLQSFMVCH